MLQTEDSALRAMLVEMLAAIKGKQATAVLAQRSVFDISPEIREQAVAALASRPVEEYEPLLVAALRWPWQPAAEHAAEAIAALQKKELAPPLVRLLAEPDPKLPFHSADKKSHVREVVRLNHLSNCILCHAPSASKDDLVRGRIPVPGQEMPPLYYADTRGYFVRADTTLLRQDFSLIQPVENPGKWAGQQRYDYLLRERPATAAELKASHPGKKDPPKEESPEVKSYPQREAVLFALREITGMDAGERTEDWKKALAGAAE
jgi:hypothetical protein